MDSVRLEPIKLTLVGTRTTYEATGDVRSQIVSFSCVFAVTSSTVVCMLRAENVPVADENNAMPSVDKAGYSEIHAGVSSAGVLVGHI